MELPSDDDADCPLFDPSSLAAARQRSTLKFDGDGDKYRLRPLRSADFARGHLDLLSQLTVTGDVDQKTYADTFAAMKANADTYYIIVVEDTQRDRIVASGSLVLEKKFIHSCGQRGRIEDIVVDSDYRGKRFGKIVVQHLIALARVLKCYKISLECKDSNVNWYNSMGFVSEHGNSNYMQMRFEESVN